MADPRPAAPATLADPGAVEARVAALHEDEAALEGLLALAPEVPDAAAVAGDAAALAEALDEGAALAAWEVALQPAAAAAALVARLAARLLGPAGGPAGARLAGRLYAALARRQGAEDAAPPPPEALADPLPLPLWPGAVGARGLAALERRHGLAEPRLEAAVARWLADGRLPLDGAEGAEVAARLLARPGRVPALLAALGDDPAAGRLRGAVERLAAAAREPAGPRTVRGRRALLAEARGAAAGRPPAAATLSPDLEAAALLEATRAPDARVGLDALEAGVTRLVRAGDAAADALLRLRMALADAPPTPPALLLEALVTHASRRRVADGWGAERGVPEGALPWWASVRAAWCAARWAMEEAPPDAARAPGPWRAAHARLAALAAAPPAHDPGAGLALALAAAATPPPESPFGPAWDALAEGWSAPGPAAAPDPHLAAFRAWALDARREALARLRGAAWLRGGAAGEGASAAARALGAAWAASLREGAAAAPPGSPEQAVLAGALDDLLDDQPDLAPDVALDASCARAPAAWRAGLRRVLVTRADGDAPPVGTLDPALAPPGVLDPALAPPGVLDPALAPPPGPDAAPAPPADARAWAVRARALAGGLHALAARAGWDDLLPALAAARDAPDMDAVAALADPARVALADPAALRIALAARARAARALAEAAAPALAALGDAGAPWAASLEAHRAAPVAPAPVTARDAFRVAATLRGPRPWAAHALGVGLAAALLPPSPAVAAASALGLAVAWRAAGGGWRALAPVLLGVRDALALAVPGAALVAALPPSPPLAAVAWGALGAALAGAAAVRLAALARPEAPP